MALNLEVSTTLWHAIEPNRKRLTQENYRLATGIAGLLARIIDQQDEIVLSVEYEHILETMALEDVPGLFKQFAEIPSSHAELVAEGNRILHGQLETILNKVNEIKEEYSRSQVTALRAKNSYIGEKYAPKPVETEEKGLAGLKPIKAKAYAPDLTDMMSEIGATAPEKKAVNSNRPKRKWLFG